MTLKRSKNTWKIFKSKEDNPLEHRNSRSRNRKLLKNPRKQFKDQMLMLFMQTREQHCSDKTEILTFRRIWNLWWRVTMRRRRRS